MIKRLTRIFTTLALGLSLATAAWAAPLSGQQVKSFIDSMPEFTKIGEQYEHETPQQENVDTSRPLSSSLEQLDPKDPAHKELTQLVKRHGFSDLKQWAEVGDRVINAYVFAFSGATIGELQETLNTALADITNNPHIPAEQKAALLQSMQGIHMKPSTQADSVEQDLLVIQPYMSEIENIFD